MNDSKLPESPHGDGEMPANDDRMREPFFFRWLFVCISGLMPFSIVDWTFSDLAFQGYVTISVAALAATVKSRQFRRIATVVSIILAVLFLTSLPVLFPLRTPLKGGHFEDVPLAEVLEYISRQKPTRLYWRFHVPGQAMTRRRITVELSDGLTLGEALHKVAAASGCEFHWGWHKFMGCDTSPICASFHFRGVGAPVDHERLDSVIIDRHEVLP